MKFSYKARTRDGQIELGSIEAYSKEAAVGILQKYNIFVTSLEELAEKKSFFWKKSIKTKIPKKDLAVFFRQLAVMLESSVPVVQSLFSLAAEIKKISFKKTILKVTKLVEEGIPLSQALAMHPETFSSLYVNLVKSGEVSGKISSALYSVSSHLEKEHDISSKVRQSMIYPIFLVCVLFFVIGIVITQIVPKIENLVQETGNNPSLLTAAMLNFYKFLGQYWLFLILALLLTAAFAIFYFRTAKGKEKYNQVSLRVPFLGKFLRKVFLARFCNNVSTLLMAGISINKALEVAEDTMNNAVYKGIIIDIRKKVSGGERLSLAMERHQSYFPSFVVQMIKVGEETGKLDKTLVEVVVFYEKEIERSISLFSKLLEPIMIIVLGLIVAVLAASVLSSIYEVVGTI